jgi:stage V sporulation protein B
MSPAVSPETVPAPTADTARTAGRGGVAVLGAKLFFLLVGFAQQPLLRLVVGLTDFGALAQALAYSNVVNNVVVTSGTQGVSRAIAGSRGKEDEVLRAALRVHVPLAFVVAGLMAGATPLYAVFERAPDVVAPLLVLAGVALLYGLYAPLIGYLNGCNRFGRQALLDVIFATLRTVGLIGVGYAFVRGGLSGVLGTTVGWLGAAAIIVPLAARSTGLRLRFPGTARAEEGPAAARPIGDALDVRDARGRGVPTTRAYLAVLGPIAGGQLCTNALMQIDILLLGRFLSEGAAAAGVAGDAQREAVKQWVAIYKECQTFAFLPYQLLFSVTLVLFPMLARAQAAGDAEAVRGHIARGARLAAIFGGLLVGVVVAIPESMLSFAYGPADAAKGADVLRTMALAQGAFAMLGIATTVLTSLGRERMAALITLGAVVAVGGACALVVPGAAFGHDQLVRSALASGGALLVTLAVAGALVRARTGAFVPVGTALRVALVLAVCVAVGFVTPRFGRLVTPLVAAGVGAVYLILLAITREIGPADLRIVSGVLRRGKR